MCPGFLAHCRLFSEAEGQAPSSLLGSASLGSLQEKQALLGGLQSPTYSIYLTTFVPGTLMLTTSQSSLILSLWELPR